MKTYAEIEITFGVDLESGTITFIAGNIIGAETFTVTEEFVPIRKGPNKVSVKEPTENPGEASAIEFVKAFNADYNLTKLFVVERVVNVVTIKSTDYDIDFDDARFEAPANITAQFTARGTEPFAITSITFTPHATDKCGKVMVNVETTSTADAMTAPVSIPNNTDNPIVFEYSRLGFNITPVTVTKGSDTVYAIANIPAAFNAASIQLQVDQNGTSSNVTVIMVTVGGLEFEYSLDNTDFQESNLFSGLVSGDYTMYVRDQYGCVREKAFTISEIGSLRSPYIHIPKSNSIRFANRITWGDCGNYKNDENTLSCEVDVPVVFKEIQSFQSCDIITTQFRSNYEINDVVISGDVNPLTDPVFVPVEKKTNHMNLKDRRDAVRFVMETGQTGIYFTDGNIYNYDTGAQESEYALNGNLPEWGVAGNWVKVGLSWYLIEDVIFSDDKNAFVLVTTTGYTGDEGTIEVSCFYDRFNYEVYEFVIDFFNFLNKRIQVNIHFTDSIFDQVNYISEVIDVKVRHKNTIEIRYKNKQNTDVFFGTGIEHKVRIPLERQDGIVIDESENHKTDTSTTLLSASVYEGDVFELGPVTKAIMHQLVQAFHHSDLKMDGVDYVKESLEVEGPLEESNLYMVKPTLVKAKNVYSSDTGDMDFIEGSLEIPGLVDSGDNSYMTYG